MSAMNGTHILARATLVIAGLALLGLMLAVFVLAGNWPFTQMAVTKALQDRFARPVIIHRFRSTYFPPGCVAEDVEFLHRRRKDLPPLIHVQTLTIRTGYSGLLRIHKLINDIQVVGLHVVVPPAASGDPAGTFPLTNSPSGGPTLEIGEIAVHGAILEFRSRQDGDEPFILNIENLRLDHVGANDPVTFHAKLHNTEPPGEIQSDGRFGPWDDENPGATAVSGAYTYQNAALGVFNGISGSLSSHGKFGGKLSEIDAEGDVEVPDFEISGTGHKNHLRSSFKAVVDGTNGNTHLTRVETRFGRTSVISQGDVKGVHGQHGKTVSLHINIEQGRVEDLLHLFAASAKPAETGDVRLQTQVEVPPGPALFLTRLRLTGDFGIGGGRFTDPKIQMPVDRLAESAGGETKDQEEADPATVLSNLKGHMSASGGVARLSNVSFSEPGTLAEIGGTYNLLDKKVDMRGVLHTSGKLADTTAGFKAVVLKALGPFLKKKSMTVVPFSITGTSDEPSVGLDLTAKRDIR
jgi:hypothetical protein